MIFRETEVVTLSQLGQEFLYPEKIRVQLSSDVRAAPIDIGSFAYTVRRELDWRNTVSGNPTQVDVSSFQKYRRSLISGILDSIFVGGSREKSVLFTCKNFRYVLDWCDTNGYSDVFLSIESTRKAYLAYNDYLRNEIIIHGRLKPMTCAGRQSFFVQLIKIMFGDDFAHITHGVPTIRAGARKRRDSPKDIDVVFYTKVCLDLARSFSDFVLEDKSFPFEMQCAEQKVVLFPSMKGMLTPLNISSSNNAIYNYDECRLISVQEYVDISGYPPSVCARALNAGQANIDRANSDLRHEQRVRLASMAMNAYACLFSLLTGASPTELQQFDYDSALEIEKSVVKREFDSVKFRAGGKKTSYVIGRGPGLQLLKDYLKIRCWILNGAKFKYLFFSLEKIGVYTGGFKTLSSTFTFDFHERLKGVFMPEDFKYLTSSRERKYKSLVLHQLKFAPEQVAASMNHTPKMNLDSYAETTIDRYEEEFEVYWRAIRRATERVRERAKPGESATVLGHCDEMNSPVQITQFVPIKPDCRTQYGCLYCANYVCHADQEDVHKIVSLEYVIQAVRELAVDMNHADHLFKELSFRVSFLLSEIANTSSEAEIMISAVKRRVFELGELTPFWESRLQRYELMGVVF